MSKTKEQPQLLTVREAAELLRVSEDTVYTLVARRKLPGVLRVGRALRFDRLALVAELRERAG